MGNRQAIHIRVEELKEIFFHTSNAIKTPETVEISIPEKCSKTGEGGKSCAKNCTKFLRPFKSGSYTTKRFPFIIFRSAKEPSPLKETFIICP